MDNYNRPIQSRLTWKPRLMAWVILDFCSMDKWRMIAPCKGQQHLDIGQRNQKPSSRYWRILAG